MGQWKHLFWSMKISCTTPQVNFYAYNCTVLIFNCRSVSACDWEISWWPCYKNLGLGLSEWYGLLACSKLLERGLGREWYVYVLL